MGVKYTKEQQQVIDLRDRNILVSAAAGSGKTAVLVERIITRLTKDASPINVDELLVVTFTEAAAAEMKERIRNVIEKALEQEPENEHLQRQATLVHQAKIMTIHGFCMSVIRDYFHTIDLDPAFRTGEDGELQLLQLEVMAEVLEKWYEKGSAQFHNLVDSFAGAKGDDKRLEDIIIKLYRYSTSYPNPKAWLDTCVQYYCISTKEELEQTPFVQNLIAETKLIFKDIEENIMYAKLICQEDDGPKAYESALDSDLMGVRKIQQADGFCEIQELLSKFTWESLKAKGKGCSEEKVQVVKGLREAYKKIVGTVVKRYFYEDIETMLQNMNAARSNVEVLIALVKDFAAGYSAKKQSKNLIDYNDMEHYALQILTREEAGVFEPSSVAKEYQERFKEVMIDEYQDSNYVQEALLTSVSTVSEGKYNMFMVGDVKQSVYRFRLARPELFMEKYHEYSDTDAKQQRIDLHKNFRSRREVLDSTNYIFRQVMTEGFGGIEYDDKVALHVGAAYEEKSGNETEVLLIDVSESLEDLSARETEALVIARKIQTLVGRHEVYDKKLDAYRKAEYRDIVVLTRSIKGWSDIFLKTLTEEGIPAYSIQKEGYFAVREIQLLLDYLRVLDNPRQDIPFTAILSSMFAGVTAEELAMIKNEAKGKCFYERVRGYVDIGSDHILKSKLQEFMEQLEYFRNKVPYTAMHDLLWEILDKTGFDNYVSALPAGEQRTANLEMLIEKAIAFENTSYKGLFHFVRYIEQLQKYKVDFGEANIQDESANVVNLMSIHKSKGLEFPIVIVAGMDKGFNLQDNNDIAVLHSQLGVGIDYVNLDTREQTPLLLRHVIQSEITKETVAEELRLLYVAMTRAKEKLILVGTIKNLKKRMADYSRLKYRHERALPYSSIAGARRYFDWVLPALYRNRVFAPVLNELELEHPWRQPFYQEPIPFEVKVVRLDDVAMDIIEEEWKDSVTKEILQHWDTEKIYDKELKEHLEKQFSFSYPYASETTTKQKVSVSELKKQAYLEEEEIEEEVVIPLLPKFMQQDTKASGAMRGTAYHRVLELLDFSQDYDEQRLAESIDTMVAEHLLAPEMSECITAQDILTFIQSPIGERMKKAVQRKLLHTEQPFVLGEENEAAQMILVQGIIDVYFEEEGELVVLDYKTDKVWCADELVERYKLQLDYYAKVLEQVTGKRVKEKIIYSFTLLQEIQLS